MSQLFNLGPQPSIEQIATFYKDAPGTIIPDHKLKVMKQLVAKQFGTLSTPIYFDFVNWEPYGEDITIEKVLQDFYRGLIKIHTTGNESPIWGPFYNLQFRAVHDYIHCYYKIEFNHASELVAFLRQWEYSLIFKNEFPHLDWDTYYKVLRSEIVYQSAFKEVYKEFHIDQKIVLADMPGIEEQ